PSCPCCRAWSGAISFWSKGHAGWTPLGPRALPLQPCSDCSPGGCHNDISLAERRTSRLAAGVNRSVKPLPHLPSPASPHCHPFIGKALAHCWLNQAYSSEVDIMTAIRDTFRAGQISPFSSYKNMMQFRSPVFCAREQNAKHGCHCHHDIAGSITGRT
ncbi:hypothetical protein J4Q44_G00091830, partial [Coregonus suidteri]